jgi:hypothetical protein
LNEEGALNTIQPDDYDLEVETASSIQMLEERIPVHLREAFRLLTENAQNFENWQADLLFKLLRRVEGNCQELLETIGKDRLPAAAWIARNLLELWVWIKYCGTRRDNARRFHEDALRDLKGLSELQKELCALHGVDDQTSAMIAQKLKAVAAEHLALDDVDSNYLAVKNAAGAEGVNLARQYLASHRFLSKFAHPTAGLVIGIMHQDEKRRELQAVCTTQGVYFAAQGTLAVEAVLQEKTPPA